MASSPIGAYQGSLGPIIYRNDFGLTRHIYYPLTGYLVTKNGVLRMFQPEIPITSDYVNRKYSSTHDWNADTDMRLLRIRAEAARINHSWSKERGSPKYTRPLIHEEPVRPTYRSPYNIIKDAERKKEESRRRDWGTRDLEKYQHRLRVHQRCPMMRKAEYSDEMKQNIRGKSPNSIAQALVNDAMKNVQKARAQDLKYARSF